MEPEVNFDSEAFENKLLNLKDTQDSIQALSSWCLHNRAAHKKIVNTWLSVLKTVTIQQRLSLFYLANDVIQYSKRKNYEFVDSWGTSLQRATTLVRDDEKVKAKVLRIFKIWEQRSIYSEEFLTGLYDLLKITTVKKKEISPAKNEILHTSHDTDDYQMSALVSSIRDCVKLEKITDINFKIVAKANVPDPESIKNTMKDRSQVEDAERDVDEAIKRHDKYINSLKAEIKARKILMTALGQAEEFYKTQRGEVKMVANAYKNFGNRIKSLRKKLDELTTTLPSPLPSPTFDAPSPEPDNDYDLPGNDFYNPSMSLNGFSSYMNSGVPLPFDINDFNRESPPNTLENDRVKVQSIEVINSRSEEQNVAPLNEFYKTLIPQDPFTPSPVSNPNSFSYDGNTSFGNLPPPPPPPVSIYGNPTIAGPPQNNFGAPSGYNSGPPPPPPLPNNFNPDYGNHQYPPPNLMPPPTMAPNHDSNDEYDPYDFPWNTSQDSEVFDPIETPVSPPHYEREGHGSDIIEYVDNSLDLMATGDVDHRPAIHPDLIAPKPKDIDHRNLISLTGSPGQQLATAQPKTLDPTMTASPTNKMLGKPEDTDYRLPMNSGHTVPGPPQPPQMLLPPPPMPEILLTDMDRYLNIPKEKSFDVTKMPAPQSFPSQNRQGNVTKLNRNNNSRNGDNNDESIDMEMSDDDATFGDDIDNPEYFDDNQFGGQEHGSMIDEDHLNAQRKAWIRNQNGSENSDDGSSSLDDNLMWGGVPNPGPGLLGMAPPGYMQPPPHMRGGMNNRPYGNSPYRGGPMMGPMRGSKGNGSMRGSPYRGGMNRGGIRGHNRGGFRGGFRGNFRGNF